MPRQASSRKAKPIRSAPYHTRSTAANNIATTTTSESGMAITLTSPLSHGHGWAHMVPQPHAYHIPMPQPWSTHSPVQYTHLHHQSQSTLANPYSTVSSAAAIPSAPAVQATNFRVQATSQHAQLQNSAWTTEMDDILVEHHRRMKWDVIATRFFNGEKTGNACRKRYARVLQERKEPARWSADRTSKVIDAYNQEGLRAQTWMPLAEATNEKWQDVERLCLAQGYRQMVRRDGRTHSRRTSRAASISQRSQPSISSDYETTNAYPEDEPKDDSGIGDDLYAQPGRLGMPSSDDHYPYHHGPVAGHVHSSSFDGGTPYYP